MGKKDYTLEIIDTAWQVCILDKVQKQQIDRKENDSKTERIYSSNKEK